MDNQTDKCGCDIHLRALPDKPCLGHGDECPCTKLRFKWQLSKDEEDLNEQG